MRRRGGRRLAAAGGGGAGSGSGRGDRWEATGRDGSRGAGVRMRGWPSTATDCDGGCRAGLPVERSVFQELELQRCPCQ